MSWLDPLYPKSGDAWWGSKLLRAIFDKIVEILDTKAPDDHEHTVGGTTIITRGDAAARSGTGITLHVRTDEDKLERVDAGAVDNVYATEAQTIYGERLADNWADPSELCDDFNNENVDFLGRPAIKLPADMRSIIRGKIRVPVTGKDIRVKFSAAMSTGEANKVCLGFAFAKAAPDLLLLDKFWHGYYYDTPFAEGDQVISLRPDGGVYEVESITADGYSCNLWLDYFSAGTASASRGTAANACDDNDGTVWATSNAAVVGDYWAYDRGAGNEVVPGYLKIKWSGKIGCTELLVQGSNNGADWETLRTLTYTADTPNDHVERLAIEGIADYRHTRLWANAVDGSNPIAIKEIQMVAKYEPDWSGLSVGAGTVWDNQVEWKKVADASYQLVDLGGKAMPATAETEGEIYWDIPGAGLVEGDILYLLLWRNGYFDNPYHGGDMYLITCTHQALEA